MTGQTFARYDAYKNSGVEWLDEIPAHWRVTRIQDITTKVGDGLHATPKYVDLSDFHFINGNNLVNGRIVISDETKCISEEEFVKLRKNLNETTILLSINGTIGNLAYYRNEKVVLGKSAAYLNFRKHHSRDFFYYFLQSIKVSNFFETTLTSTTIKNLSLKTLRTTSVVFPSLPEQRAIAAYLDTRTATLDRQIALLTQKTAHYADLKQSLINHTVTHGLDPAVPLKDSGIEWIGEIPAHWKIHRIKDHTYVKGRIGWQGLRSSDFLDKGDYYCVTGTDFINGTVNWSTCYYVSQDRYSQDKFIQLKSNDLLITKDGSIGKIALIDELPLPATLNSGLFVTRPLRDKYVNKFMYWVLKSSLFLHFIDLTKGGSTVQHLYQNVFNRFLYVCPPLPEQRAIAAYLDERTAHIDRIIAAINAKIAALQELRQTLINDVVTGKIRVT